MKLLAALLLCVNTFVAAQDEARKLNVGVHEVTDTIFADTEPAMDIMPFNVNWRKL